MYTVLAAAMLFLGAAVFAGSWAIICVGFIGMFLKIFGIL